MKTTFFAIFFIEECHGVKDENNKHYFRDTFPVDR